MNTNAKPRRRWYVGALHMTPGDWHLRYRAFPSARTPTPESFPDLILVVGPFPTKRGAVFYAANPAMVDAGHLNVANADAESQRAYVAAVQACGGHWWEDGEPPTVRTEAPL